MEQEKLSKSTDSRQIAVHRQKDLTAFTNALSANILLRDKAGVATQLAPFMDKGKPNYPVIFQVPRADRLPALAEKDQAGAVALVSTAVALALSTSGITDDCAYDTAEIIINEAAEDQLTIQDVVIFCKAAAAGKYGPFLRNNPTPMDFMSMFEKYRQERHETIVSLRDEQHTQLKAQGPAEKESEDRESVKQLHKNAVMQHYLN